MTNGEGKILHVLIVEDNKVDARLARLAIEGALDSRVDIAIADDGEKAIAYLRRQGAYAGAERPDLVVLDLNLPKYDGTEVLQVIRNSADLNDLTVAILSSSPLDVIEDKVRDAQVEADGYFTKPFHLDDFLAVGREICRCLSTAEGRRR